MDTINFWEWVGYIGSVIVIISLTMKSMIKLRWFNLLGAIIFTVYGLVINAMPVFAVNILIACINIYYLIQIYTSENFFQLIEVNENDGFLSHFVNNNSEDISKYFPNYKISKNDNNISLLILRDMSVASVFVGKKTNNNTLEIELDYALPQYQDFKTGDYLFNTKSEVFKSKGINKLIIKPFAKNQDKYYTEVGFKFYKDKGVYIKNLV